MESLRMIEKHGWVNYGDLNPIEHGGQFVKHDNDLPFERCYNVVLLKPFYDDNMQKDLWLIEDTYIDLTDDWIEWESVNTAYGLGAADSDMLKAVSVADYYQSDYNNVLNSVDEVVEELSRYGIEFREE